MKISKFDILLNLLGEVREVDLLSSMKHVKGYIQLYWKPKNSTHINSTLVYHIVIRDKVFWNE